MNLRQKTNLITLKVILKKSNFETIEEIQKEETDVNLRRESNPYQYNIIDNFK